MKVLYLVPQPKSPDRLAAYSFLDEELQALAGAGVEALVLSTLAPADTMCGKVCVKSAATRATLGNRLRAAAFRARGGDGITAHVVRHPAKWLRSAWVEHTAATIVEQERVDLIHSHFAWPQGLGGTLVSAATGRPLVASLRGTDILADDSIQYGRRSKPHFDRGLRRLLESADRTVYFSNYMRDHALSLGARPERARVIRKGVDLHQFKVAADRLALRSELGLGSRPMILTVAGLIPRKGVHHILEALASLKDDHDFTFVVCGDGPERARLEAKSAELGLGDRTVFTGRVDRQTIPKYFAACDVFVLASIMEAAGNVLFEAMASGRPVVCTDSGGPGEYVKDGVTGFVVPVADPPAMAARIRLLLEDSALCDRLGAEAHRRTVGEFDYDRMVSDLIDVYRDVLGASHSQRVAV